MRDTGDVAEVPEDQQLEVDEGEGSIAGESPDNEGLMEALAACYADPGELVDEGQLQ